MELFFAYGTFRVGSGHEMQRWLTAHAALIGEASVRGVLYDLGGYPGLVVETAAPDAVRGDVYRLHPETTAETLRQLDAYEGCGPGSPEPHECRRTRIQVRLDGGESVDAWVYVLRDVRGLERIPSGDSTARH